MVVLTIIIGMATLIYTCVIVYRNLTYEMPDPPDWGEDEKNRN